MVYLLLFQIFWTMMMMWTMMTQTMMSQILMNSSLSTTVAGLLALGTVERNVISLYFSGQHITNIWCSTLSVQGRCKICQDFVRWRIWSGKKECGNRSSVIWKDSEGSIKNVLWDFGMQSTHLFNCCFVMILSRLFRALYLPYTVHWHCAVWFTGPDDKGLHYRGATKTIRFCQHKARTKAIEVRFLG
jgi:hypothetical protein